MPVLTYTPSSIRLDPDCPMRREVPDVAQLDVLSGPGNDPSAAGYDHTTVIYDVLLTARNARVLLIGPPLLNLADVLWPATFTLVLRGGRQVELKPRREDRSHYFIAHMRVPRRHRSDVTDNSILRVRFADGSTYDVRPNPVDETPVALSLSTQQRDESTVWLRQWAAYWHSLGADRVIIYDNGSSYFSELPQLLADVAQDLSIVVVRWHFEFGPPRGFAYHYAQWASLNHARLAFPGARWGAAFDVDEYPVLRKDGGLIAFLDRQSRATGLVLLKLFDVKNIRWTPASDGEPPSAADFVYRSERPRRPSSTSTGRSGREIAPFTPLESGRSVRSWLTQRRPPTCTTGPSTEVGDTRSVSSRWCSTQLSTSRTEQWLTASAHWTSRCRSAARRFRSRPPHRRDRASATASGPRACQVDRSTYRVDGRDVRCLPTSGSRRIASKVCWGWPVRSPARSRVPTARRRSLCMTSTAGTEAMTSGKPGYGDGTGWATSDG